MNPRGRDLLSTKKLLHGLILVNPLLILLHYIRKGLQLNLPYDFVLVGVDIGIDIAHVMDVLGHGLFGLGHL